ncbi:STAS/SEC14 domain-containing protein [Sulfitobacter sp. D35]|uniref:STAS/SEC14 domain-containing protein n=1 Tax=Sulfitobacter sp. D35 TaxID=3083252 RepID=UPI00296EE1EB|nr:STAS/SEC14 domain-containing protein [Sulfitobacter sp. D35]MDW4496420.1 STAS/SEC14 domain-containing protein [Sulfitobacter sp. D35]
MIEVEQIGAHGIVEIRMSGPVSDKDYTDTLVPAIDAAIAQNETVRLLAIIESGFSDFTLGAIIEDARTGMKHWRGFDRAAIVTDNAAMKRVISAVSVFMPCPVATFDVADVDSARSWLRESLGTIQQVDLENGVLQVRLRGKLDTEAYERDIEDLNRYMAAHDKVRLLIDLRDFDGWQGLGALKDHFHLVRGHARKVERAAVVGDAGWQEMAVQVGKRAFGLDARHFDADDFDAARTWLTP